MNNTAIQIAFSTLLFAKLWLRSEEGEADYSNMEVVKTLMIIQSLVMCVTMAYKVLGVSKRDHILKSLNRAELNEEISEDKPDVRHKLTRDASRISMDDADTFYYESPCTKEEVKFPAVKYKSYGNGKLKLVSEKLFPGVVCKEYKSVGMWYESVNDEIPVKVCNPQQSPHMYCFTETKTRSTGKVSFKVFRENEKAEWVDLHITIQDKMPHMKYGVGCACMWQHHVPQAGDSIENRAGEQ